MTTKKKRRLWKKKKKGIEKARKSMTQRERDIYISRGSVRGTKRERRRGREIAVARIPEIAKEEGDKIRNRKKDPEVILE